MQFSVSQAEITPWLIGLVGGWTPHVVRNSNVIIILCQSQCNVNLLTILCSNLVVCDSSHLDTSRLPQENF